VNALIKQRINWARNSLEFWLLARDKCKREDQKICDLTTAYLRGYLAAMDELLIDRQKTNEYSTR